MLNISEFYDYFSVDFGWYLRKSVKGFMATAAFFDETYSDSPGAYATRRRLSQFYYNKSLIRLFLEEITGSDQFLPNFYFIKSMFVLPCQNHISNE